MDLISKSINSRDFDALEFKITRKCEVNKSETSPKTSFENKAKRSGVE